MGFVQHEMYSHVCRVIEIGSGSGFVICSVARMLKSLGVSAHVIAVDINPEACQATVETLTNHEVRRFCQNRVKVMQGCYPTRYMTWRSSTRTSWTESQRGFKEQLTSW